MNNSLKFKQHVSKTKDISSSTKNDLFIIQNSKLDTVFLAEKLCLQLSDNLTI